MAAYNPKYTVAIIAESTSRQYDVTPAITSLTLKEMDNEIAQRVNINLANIKVNEQYLTGIFDVRDRVFVYANDGKTKAEVFRGYIWAKGYTSKKEKELQLVCYDNLIYFQESEEYQFFSAGYSLSLIHI